MSGERQELREWAESVPSWNRNWIAKAVLDLLTREAALVEALRQIGTARYKGAGDFHLVQVVARDALAAYEQAQGEEDK